jgi:hypothetical protein
MTASAGDRARLKGFRVPLIVVSPYAKAGYIFTVTDDFGSVLHFVEQAYDPASLGRRGPCRRSFGVLRLHPDSQPV